MQKLDEEISTIYQQNTDLDSHLAALRSEIVSMETNMKQQMQENELIKSKTNGLNNDMAYIRRQLIQTLGDIPLPTTNETLREDNFDSYMAQLKELCLDNYSVENRALLGAVKQALSTIAV